MNTSPNPNKILETLSTAFRYHRLAYVVSCVLVVLVNILLSGAGWLFWVLFAWGIVFAVHFFFVKSISVDDDWVDERTQDLRERSYDLGHIEDIVARDIKPHPPGKTKTK